jgi:hypothetical protein
MAKLTQGKELLQPDGSGIYRIPHPQESRSPKRTLPERCQENYFLVGPPTTFLSIRSNAGSDGSSRIIFATIVKSAVSSSVR